MEHQVTDDVASVIKQGFQSLKKLNDTEAREVGELLLQAKSLDEALILSVATKIGVTAKSVRKRLSSVFSKARQEVCSEKVDMLSPVEPRFKGKWALDQASAERLDGLIEDSEHCFSELGDSLRKKLPAKPHNPRLFLPFDLVKNNKNFAHKNGIKIRMHPQHIAMSTGNFLYDLLPASVLGKQHGNTKLIAAFNPQYRQFQVPIDYDPHRLIDLIIKYHEIWHAQQDDWLRCNYGLQTAHMLYAQKAQIVDFESEAYAFMVELTDLYSDGEFKERCKKTITNADIVWLHTMLQGRPGMEKLSELFLTIGRKLWHVSGSPLTGEDDTYPAEYEQFMINYHRGPQLRKIDRTSGKILQVS